MDETWKNVRDRTFFIEKTLKESERGSVCLVRDAASGERYILRTLVGGAEVYQKIKNAAPPHIPRIEDIAERDGKTYVLEEYIQGDTLAFLLDFNPIAPETAKGIIIQICEALDALHCLGVVHRDIKPENVLLRDSEAVLIDFDVSRICKPEHRADTQVMGTAGYAAPEQYGFSQTDGRADIYALGVMINEMLTKQHPSKYLTESAFRPVVEKCIEVNADKRYSSASQLRFAIEKTELCPKAAKKKPLRLILPACILALLIIGGAVFWGNHEAKNALPTETLPASLQETVPTPTPHIPAGIYMDAENGVPQGDVIVISRKNDAPPWGFWLDYYSGSETPLTFYYYDTEAGGFSTDSDRITVTSAGEHLWKVTLNEGTSGEQTLTFFVPTLTGEENIIPVVLTDLTPSLPAPLQSTVERWPGAPENSGTWFAYDLDGDGQSEQYYFAPAMWLQLSNENVFTFCAKESFSCPIYPGEVRYRYIIPAVWSYADGDMPTMVPEFFDLLHAASVTLWRVDNLEAEAPLVYAWEDYGSGAVEIHYLKDHEGTWLYEVSAELNGKVLHATGLSNLRKP